MSNTITFANQIQKTLFICEIAGQLSDGAWENTMPSNHWEAWCDADIEFSKNTEFQGRNFSTMKRGYNLHMLIEYVGERMIVSAKLAGHMTDDEINALAFWLDDDKYESIPERHMHIIDKYGIDTIKKWISETDYTEKHLRKELTSMKKIMKHHI